MTPTHVFGVAVRIVGLIVVLFAVLYMVSGVATSFVPKPHSDDPPNWTYFMHGTVELVIGLCLLRGPSWLVRFAYPPTPEA